MYFSPPSRIYQRQKAQIKRKPQKSSRSKLCSVPPELSALSAQRAKISVTSLTASSPFLKPSIVVILTLSPLCLAQNDQNSVRWSLLCSRTHQAHIFMWPPRLVTLTKTEKKSTRAHKSKFMEEVRIMSDCPASSSALIVPCCFSPIGPRARPEMEIRIHCEYWQHAKLCSQGSERKVERVGTCQLSPITFWLSPLRSAPRTGRLFFGRTRVMAAALGTSEDTECRTGISALARVGIICLMSRIILPTYIKPYLRSI